MPRFLERFGVWGLGAFVVESSIDVLYGPGTLDLEAPKPYSRQSHVE